MTALFVACPVCKSNFATGPDYDPTAETMTAQYQCTACGEIFDWEEGFLALLDNIREELPEVFEVNDDDES